MRRQSTRTLVQLALLTGIEAIFAFTVLGSLPIGPLVATLAHIPVIIAAVILGYGPGLYMGFVFGFLSFIVHSFTGPTPVSFVFTPIYAGGLGQGSIWSLVICFVPRMLLPLAATAIYRAFRRVDRRGYVAAASAATLSSLVHTALVLGGIYVFFGASYAQAIGKPFEVLLSLIMTAVVTNGVPEALIAGVVMTSLVIPLSRFQQS